jgi:hypothetical protein
MKLINKILAIGFILFSNSIMARPASPEFLRDTIDPLEELMKIQEHYMNGANTPPDTLGVGPFGTWTFNVYDYNDDTITSSSIKYLGLTIVKNRFIFTTDSIHFVQDEMYNITIYRFDSILHVQPPIPFYQAFLQVDLLDTSLHIHQVRDIRLWDSVGYRWIRFEFKNESPLIELIVKTDWGGYTLHEVDYKMKKEIVQTGLSHLSASSYHDYIRVRLELLGESGGIINMNLFDTSKIVKRENGILVPTSLYQGFELVNALDK